MAAIGLIYSCPPIWLPSPWHCYIYGMTSHASYTGIDITSHNTLLASVGLNIPMMILMSVLFHSSKVVLRSRDSFPAKLKGTAYSLAKSLTKFSAD